jgi:hypothetical protein
MLGGMNKTVVACVAILAVAVIASVCIYSSGSRYVTVNAGEGRIYRTDRKTGKTVLIKGVSELVVESPEAVPATKPETPSEQAIRKAKVAYTLGGYPVDNESWVRSQMEKATGPLRIIGWEAKKFVRWDGKNAIDDQIYLVTYSFEQTNGVRCFPVEVNLEGDIVRKIIGDSELERKYGFGH